METVNITYINDKVVSESTEDNRKIGKRSQDYYNSKEESNSDSLFKFSPGWS